MYLCWLALTSFVSSQSALPLNFSHSSAIDLLSRGGTGRYFGFPPVSVSSLLDTINEVRQGSSFSKTNGSAVGDDDDDVIAAAALAAAAGAAVAAVALE